ncbi:MAG: hypothetical protein A3F67_05155 [Verrucomicrobia bacterium RIFCSPHIGHO2_12_FULL_41_10]|nr:MAG: hypothetical protein A3F67_05155 [Verrucomicrobia bacterium RIFCSPHIGHO2_12_FULL_41_10]
MGINSYYSTGQKLQSVQFGPFVEGIDEATEPHLLDQRTFSNAENLDMDTHPGRLSKRPGLQKVSSLSTVLESAPKNAFTYIKNGREMMFISDGKYVIRSEDGLTFTRMKQVKLSDGTVEDLILNTSGYPRFTQGHGKLWITNKIDPVMSWDMLDISTDRDHVLKHDKQLTDKLPNNSSFSTFVYTGSASFEINEFRGKIFAIGLKEDGSEVGATGEYSIILSNTASTGTKVFTLVNTLNVSATDGKNAVITIGASIPKCSYMQFYHETMFIADTDNPLEIRFSELSDPNQPIITINADHPNAWPAVNQLTVQAGVGDKIYGFSPVYRNRLAVFKEIGIFRIDPDPTFKFTLENFTDEVGSRFPDTWIEINGVLKFLGSRRDSKPDIFYTDFVSIGDYNRKHHITLDSLKQPKQMIKSSITTGNSWGNANMSTLTDISEGMLQVGKINIGWSNLYSCEELPEDASIAWESISLDNILSTVSGQLRLDKSQGGASSYLKKISDAFSSALPNHLSLRAKAETTVSFVLPTLNFGIWNGAKGAWVTVKYNPNLPGSAIIKMNGILLNYGINVSAFHNYSLIIDADVSSLYIDGTLVLTTSTSPTSLNKVQFGIGDMTGSPFIEDNAFSEINTFGETFTFDYIAYENTDGNITKTIDYKKAIIPSLYSFGKYFLANTTGQGSDISMFTKSSDNGIAYGAESSLSSGSIPSSTVKRFLQVRINTLCSGNPFYFLTGGILHVTKPILIGPNISQWLNFQMEHFGITTAAMKIRRSINTEEPSELGETGWYIDYPATTDQEGWKTIANGNDIGTILADSSSLPPTTRWIQIKHEMSLGSLAELETHSSSAMVINWMEGSSGFFPISANLFSKRYMLNAAKSNSTANDIMIVIDKNNKFMNWTGFSMNFMLWFKGRLYMGRSSDSNRNLYFMDEGIRNDMDDSGNPIAVTAFFETNEESMKSLFTRKKLRMMEIASNAETSNAKVSYRREIDTLFSSPVAVSFTSADTKKRIHFPIGFQAKRVVFRVLNDSQNQDMGVELMALHFEQLPSQSGL